MPVGEDFNADLIELGAAALAARLAPVFDRMPGSASEAGQG